MGDNGLLVNTGVALGRRPGLGAHISSEIDILKNRRKILAFWFV